MEGGLGGGGERSKRERRGGEVVTRCREGRASQEK